MKIQDDILSYREMCDVEKVQTLQRGMNFRMGGTYSVVLMSQRSNAPYIDHVHADGITIEYEGHDVPRIADSRDYDPKDKDQVERFPSRRLTQNGLFVRAVKDFKQGVHPAEFVKIYEKIIPGVWSLKGLFSLIGYKVVHDGKRNVFRFTLQLSAADDSNKIFKEKALDHNRLIPSEVKKEVWKRDGGQCVICGNLENLHFDHELPFSKGGTSLSVKNIRLLCMKHNLQKSAKIE
jgi:hypothetical protein